MDEVAKRRRRGTFLTAAVDAASQAAEEGRLSMLRVPGWLLVAVVALGLLVGGSVAVQAQEAAATGTVSGTVTDKDDKPVAGATVRLIKAEATRGGGGGAAVEPRRTRRLQDGGQQPPGGGRGQRPAPVATATTDADGRFTMKDVPVGDYVVRAGIRGGGIGSQRVSVEAGKEVTVNIKLTDVPPQRGGGRRGAGGGK